MTTPQLEKTLWIDSLSTTENRDKGLQLPSSFVGRSGCFYVRVPRISGGYHQQTAVYSSVDAYNTRSEKPYYINASEVLPDFSHKADICPHTLTTKWPADSDETNLGLTPARLSWANRLRKAKEG